MRPTIALTLASLKMFYRNRQAVFFSLFLPFLIMVIFGILDFGSFSDIKVGVVDEAENDLSSDLIQALGNTDVLDITKGARAEQVEALEEGDLDLLIILPESLDNPMQPNTIEGLYNANRPQEAQVAETVLTRILDDINFSVSGRPRLLSLETQEVKSREFEYVDFLVPGIIAMAIMQMGLFSVSFAIIRYRVQGVLRRLQAAPIHPRHFLVGQVVTRLTVSVAQTLILLAVGIVLLGIEVQGSYATLILLAIIGGALFISMGYAVSGFARFEESAAPIANLIAMPMMFLSGVFFSRDNLPAFLETVTEYFPLTYLANSMREVTAEGSGLVDIWGDLLGLSVWLVASFILATRVFKWE